MCISICGKVLLVSACLMAGTAVWSQQSQKPALPAATAGVSADVAVSFAAEQSETVPGQCCFWFKGGGADAAVTFWKGFGIAASLTGDTASNVAPGVDVNKIGYLAGPRYTWTAWRAAHQPRYQIFAQGLFGGAHGFDGLYPAGSGSAASTNAFALETGGGLNLFVTPHFGLRLIEADYVRTAFPNAAGDEQNDLRLSVGLVYHRTGAVSQR